MPLGLFITTKANLLAGKYTSSYWAQAFTQAYHSYRHTLLGVVEERVHGPNGPPVEEQENTALLRNCCVTGTPLRVSLSGLGEKGVLCLRALRV